MRAAAVFFAGVLALAASPALAHRGHGGLTVIEIAPETGAVTVVHRFAAHDVEPALRVVAPATQRTLDDPAALAALEDHLERRFRLEIDGERVEIDHVRTDRAGDNIRIDYGGARSPERDVQSVVVDMDFFPGVHDDQEQQVNVRVNRVTRTVVFRPGSTAQTIEFGS